METNLSLDLNGTFTMTSNAITEDEAQKSVRELSLSYLMTKISE